VVILAVTVAVVAGLAVLVRTLLFGHSYARLTPSRLTVKPWYWFPRSVPRVAVSRAMLVRVDFGRSSNQADQLRLLFLDGRNRCLVPRTGRGIGVSDVPASARALRAPFNDGMERVRPAVLRRAYPGSISEFSEHRVAYGIGLGLGLVVLTIAGVIGWAAL